MLACLKLIVLPTQQILLTAITITAITIKARDHLDIDSYTFLSFSSDGSFALRKFQNFLYKKLRESVFRAKGILWFKESEKHHVFHLADKRFCIDNSDWEGDRRNKLVLIGQDMDQDVLRKQLQNCDFKDSDPRIQ